MPVIRRSKTIDAPAEQVWALIADPHHIPRWWPAVTRIEGVEDDCFTQVRTTRKGRAVRMDFRLVESEPPVRTGERPGRLVWEQELEGTPFERLLREAVTEIALEPAGERTRVTITLNQKLRGYSRTGGFMLRRGPGGQLDEALAGLADAVGG